jgi:hypothetical protein
VGVVGSGRGGRRERALLRGHSGRWPRSARGVRAGRESEEEEGGGGGQVVGGGRKRARVEGGGEREEKKGKPTRTRTRQGREAATARQGKKAPPCVV